MKRHHRWLWTSFVALALAGVPAFAQKPTGKSKPEKPAAAKTDAKADFQKKFDDIKKRHDEARKELDKKIEAQPDDESKQKLWEAENPDKAFLAEYQKLADEAKGTEVAAKSLMQVVQIGGSVGEEDAAKAAAAKLVADHAGSAEIGLLVLYAERLLDEEAAKAALEKIAKENKTKPVQATLVFAQIQKVQSEKGEDADELVPLYQRLAKEFKDVATPWGDGNFGAMAEGWIFVRENLSIGKTAPDFETVDENGVKWKLSDYRGKVVVVDFWGNW